MPQFGITVGIPLSGKSAFCHKKMKEGWVIVNPDTFRQVYSGSENTHSLLDSHGEKVVWNCMFLTVESLLEYGHNVILDATNCNTRSRRSWKIMANNMGIKMKMFVMPFDADLSIKRNKQIRRFEDEHGNPTSEVIDKFVRSYVPPNKTEGDIIHV